MLLEVKSLEKTYVQRQGFFLPKTHRVVALDDVTFSIARGEAFGLVGESGSGKSTLGKCLLRLEEPDAGHIRFDSQSLLDLTPRQMRPLRRRMQMVFQDPHASLNPRMSIQAILSEPLDIHGLFAHKGEREDRLVQLLESVGLSADALQKYPHAFSGGQRQRIGIARALAVEPELLICDEAVSALDVSIQAQILNLLHDLKERLGLTYLFISHDLAVVRHLCSRVAVLHKGRMVEIADAQTLFSAPKDPYTQALLSAHPRFQNPKEHDSIRRL